MVPAYAGEGWCKLSTWYGVARRVLRWYSRRGAAAHPPPRPRKPKPCSHYIPSQVHGLVRLPRPGEKGGAGGGAKGWRAVDGSRRQACGAAAAARLAHLDAARPPPRSPPHPRAHHCREKSMYARNVRKAAHESRKQDARAAERAHAPPRREAMVASACCRLMGFGFLDLGRREYRRNGAARGEEALITPPAGRRLVQACHPFTTRSRSGLRDPSVRFAQENPSQSRRQTSWALRPAKRHIPACRIVEHSRWQRPPPLAATQIVDATKAERASPASARHDGPPPALGCGRRRGAGTPGWICFGAGGSQVRRGRASKTVFGGRGWQGRGLALRGGTMDLRPPPVLPPLALPGSRRRQADACRSGAHCSRQLACRE